MVNLHFENVAAQCLSYRWMRDSVNGTSLQGVPIRTEPFIGKVVTKTFVSSKLSPVFSPSETAIFI